MRDQQLNSEAANTLCVRVGDRGGVAWVAVGTISRTESGMMVTFSPSRTKQAETLWAACKEKHERRPAGQPEVFFGEQLPSGRVVLAAKGALSAQALAKLQRDVEPRRGERVDGPRAPRWRYDRKLWIDG